MDDRYQYRNNFIEKLNSYINLSFPDFMQLYVQLFVKVLLIIFITYVIYAILKRLLLPAINRYVRKSNNLLLKEMYKNRVFHALILLITLIIIYQIHPYIFYNHPVFYEYTGKIYFIACVLICYLVLYRVLNSWQEMALDDSQYISVAIKSFIQIFKIVSAVFSFFVIIFTLFDISITDIITIIGAITAFVLLIFKDPILGFVAGMQVSTTKMLKVGDWIALPKYSIEGNLSEINLITSKIVNFDQTISSIPTYDLISSEVKSFENLKHKNVRNIKRSLLCSVKSFHFLTDEEMEKFSQYPLLQKYMKDKLWEFEKNEHENTKSTKLNQRLTNIGVFRKYIELYLKQNPYIDKSNTIVVRQREMSPSGLPLEIYCFTTLVKFEKYEEVVSDIFDHIITVAKEFDIKIVQTVTL